MAIKQIDSREFQAFIRAEERARNAGATAQFHPRRNITTWTIRGALVAVSRGPVGTRSAYWIDIFSK